MKLRKEREDEPPELIRLRKGMRTLLDQRRKILRENEAAREAITELRQAVTAGIAAHKDADRELERLRGIEAATRAIMKGFGHELPEVVLWWRAVAQEAPVGVGRVCDAIADALEAKP